MKWFKHLSDLPRDEGVSRYLDAAGKDRVVAYGFFMFVIEAIASRMDWEEGDLVCSATYSITHWGRITYCHPNRVRKYLELCKVIGWVHVEFKGGMCEVSAPKMVEWRDEYTRKSGHTPDNVAQSRADQNRKEKRESKQDNALPDGLTAEGTGRSPPPDFEVTEVLQAWAAKNHPSVAIEKETAKFRLYDFGRTISDWDRQWMLWIVRAAERREESNPCGVNGSEIEQIIKLGTDLKIERKDSESDADYCDRVMNIKSKSIHTA